MLNLVRSTQIAVSFEALRPRPNVTLRNESASDFVTRSVQEPTFPVSVNQALSISLSLAGSGLLRNRRMVVV